MLKSKLILSALATVTGAFWYQGLIAQKTFDVKIVLSKHIDPQKVRCHYYGGKGDVYLDTFRHQSFELKGAFYDQYASLQLQYPIRGTSFLDFLVDSRPAEITLDLTENNELIHTESQNAILLSDSLDPMLKDLRSRTEGGVEQLTAFLAKQGKDIHPDSSAAISRNLWKQVFDTVLSGLKRYPKNYLSFWYFRNRVVVPALVSLRTDTSFLRHLMDYFYDEFPARYTASVGGQFLMKQLDMAIKPLEAREIAPDFLAKDIQGHPIHLKDFRGKEVLIDFWASWCSPCVAEIPSIREIRNSISPDSLAIISISLDVDMQRWKDAVHRDSMRWVHINDLNREIVNLYGVGSVPQVVLINKEGIVLYKGYGNNPKELMGLLRAK